VQHPAGSAPVGAAAPASVSRGQAAPCAQHRDRAGAARAAIPVPGQGGGVYGKQAPTRRPAPEPSCGLYSASRTSTVGRNRRCGLSTASTVRLISNSTPKLWMQDQGTHAMHASGCLRFKCASNCQQARLHSLRLYHLRAQPGSAAAAPRRVESILDRRKVCAVPPQQQPAHELAAARHGRSPAARARRPDSTACGSVGSHCPHHAAC